MIWKREFVQFFSGGAHTDEDVIICIIIIHMRAISNYLLLTHYMVITISESLQ